MANKVYEIITERIIEKLSEGIIPWQKPWTGSDAGMFPCYSYSTGKRYDLINQMLLDCEPGDYITFDQCVKAGGKVKKGAKSKIVVGWIVTKENIKDADGTNKVDDDGNELFKDCFALRYYRVFNVNDCEGITAKHTFEISDDDKTVSFDPDENASNIINNYLEREKTLKLVNVEGDRAYYSPSEDKVVLPMDYQFTNIAEYYSTAFHELTHSTMKATRCNREQDRKGKNVAFGSEVYSKEELVAEIGAASLVNICGLETESSFNNSAAYIQSWIKALKDDPKMIVQAATRADKAINYILGE